MGRAPAGQVKAAEENAITTSGSPAEGEALPQAPAPNAPIPEGKVEVTRKAKDGENADPAGNVITSEKISKPVRRKADKLRDLEDLSKLPVAAHVGQVAVAVREYAGRAVLAITLVGWVGEEPFKILASDVGELEQALEEIRKQL